MSVLESQRLMSCSPQWRNEWKDGRIEVDIPGGLLRVGARQIFQSIKDCAPWENYSNCWCYGSHAEFLQVSVAAWGVPARSNFSAVGSSCRFRWAASWSTRINSAGGYSRSPEVRTVGLPVLPCLEVCPSVGVSGCSIRRSESAAR